MANRWGIPNDTEMIVKQRDLNCVYCGIAFSDSNNSRKSKPSWEHIINDIKITGPENIAICCCSCNASKGSKRLEEWLKGKYCNNKGISSSTVAPIIKKYLAQVITNINDACP